MNADGKTTLDRVLDKLYDLMDWAGIEAIVYSEEDHPRRILGPRLVKGGVLIQCFFPGRER